MRWKFRSTKNEKQQNWLIRRQILVILSLFLLLRHFCQKHSVPPSNPEPALSPHRRWPEVAFSGFSANPIRVAAREYMQAPPLTAYAIPPSLQSQEVQSNPELNHSGGSCSVSVTMVAEEIRMHLPERYLGGKWAGLGEGVTQDSPTYLQV